MKKEILNLADDIFLADNSNKREAFIKEFESAVVLMRENDFDQFYAYADIIMQKYSQDLHENAWRSQRSFVHLYL